MRRWPSRWRRGRGAPQPGEPSNGPREAWLELPTGDRVSMIPVYRGIDDGGHHTWELFLEGPESITVPLKELKIGIDRIPGQSSVRLALQEVDEDNVQVFSYGDLAAHLRAAIAEEEAGT